MKYSHQYLSRVIQNDASITGGSTKKVTFHRRELDMVDRINSPLEGTGRHTERTERSTIKKIQVAQEREDADRIAAKHLESKQIRQAQKAE